jgi:hypothetical protein
MGREGLEPSTLRLRGCRRGCGRLRLLVVSRIPQARIAWGTVPGFAAVRGWCVAHPLPTSSNQLQPLACLHDGRHRRPDRARDLGIGSLRIPADLELDQRGRPDLRAALNCCAGGGGVHRGLGGQLAAAGKAVDVTTVLGPRRRPLKMLVPRHPAHRHLATRARPAHFECLISHKFVRLRTTRLPGSNTAAQSLSSLPSAIYAAMLFEQPTHCSGGLCPARQRSRLASQASEEAGMRSETRDVIAL